MGLLGHTKQSANASIDCDARSLRDFSARGPSGRQAARTLIPTCSRSCKPQPLDSSSRASMSPKRPTFADAVASPLVPAPSRLRIEEGATHAKTKGLLKYVKKLWCCRRHRQPSTHLSKVAVRDRETDEGYVPLTWDNLCRAAIC